MPWMMLFPLAVLVGLVALVVYLGTSAGDGTRQREVDGGDAPDQTGRSDEFWRGVLVGTGGIVLVLLLLMAVAGVAAMASGGMGGMMDHCDQMGHHGGHDEGHDGHDHQEAGGNNTGSQTRSVWSVHIEPGGLQPEA